ncbi:MAG: pilus assembly protein PilP [Herminiimonas sp.]|uniref:pilus assembly protein PilP n=1 Tax=Herminiimonas sp. TaxID=1926289 RepID=UPI002718DC72|nr:pilus assembly protein PilP [Herminiimonas sp.]MDO9421630.1 pilus assembly protein PilP [Herminiimonas sp.]MDO9422015.1 pilus assembly protein PilP [Herminiimonas sp.]
MKRFQLIRLGASGFLLVSLFGCGDGGIQDVSQWMKEVRQQTKVSIKPLSEPKKFTPFAYDAKGREDPYSPNKLAVALAKSKKNNGSIQPNLDRRREALESYPLDNLRMVGTLVRPGLTFALLQANNSVFQVKVGNYIGQNLGMVTKITDTEVELKEIVQDASGEWVEREAKLELQETQK